MADAEHPRHGRGSLAHGYVGACGDLCNNAQCAKGLNHGRCTEECTPDVVWDEMGCWYPDAPHLNPAATGSDHVAGTNRGETSLPASKGGPIPRAETESESH